MNTTTDQEFSTPVYDAEDYCAALDADELAAHLHALVRLNMAPRTNARAIEEHRTDIATLLESLTNWAQLTMDVTDPADLLAAAAARRAAGDYAESAVQL